MKLRISAVAIVVAALGLSGALVAGAAHDGAATATVAPVEMKFACALKSNGLMRYVTNLNQCKNTEEKITIKPGPWTLCVQPDGSTRKIPVFLSISFSLTISTAIRTAACAVRLPLRVCSI